MLRIRRNAKNPTLNGLTVGFRAGNSITNTKDSRSGSRAAIPPSIRCVLLAILALCSIRTAWCGPMDEAEWMAYGDWRLHSNGLVLVHNGLFDLSDNSPLLIQQVLEANGQKYFYIMVHGPKPTYLYAGGLSLEPNLPILCTACQGGRQGAMGFYLAQLFPGREVIALNDFTGRRVWTDANGCEFPTISQRADSADLMPIKQWRVRGIVRNNETRSFTCTSRDPWQTLRGVGLIDVDEQGAIFAQRGSERVLPPARRIVTPLEDYACAGSGPRCVRLRSAPGASSVAAISGGAISVAMVGMEVLGEYSEFVQSDPYGALLRDYAMKQAANNNWAAFCRANGYPEPAQLPPPPSREECRPSFGRWVWNRITNAPIVRVFQR